MKEKNEIGVLLLEEYSFQVRKDLLRLASQKTIHIGGALSVTDILVVLWQKIINYDIQNPYWEERDRFILSKGHCAAAVAFNQAILGCFSREDVFKEYGTDNGRFSMAPCRHLNKYFESSATGSLGQGLPIGVGIAQAIKLKQNNDSFVYVVMGDGELQEGSNWEAFLLAAQLSLDNIIVIIDNNGLQFDGFTNDIVSIRNLTDKVKNFGWDTYIVDGHNHYEIFNCIMKAKTSRKPCLIDAHTVKGKGISFMENNCVWHAGKVSSEQLMVGLADLEEAYYGNV